MPKRVAITSLNGTTIDILNTIRANASAEYQDNVPIVTTAHDVPRVGDVLFGYPALANQFLSSLMNRIALVKVKSAVFNNAYSKFKKGYLEFGETVEEVFVSIAKAREFSAEKAWEREFKRTIPDVRTAFHTMNWRVQYPITIQNEDLRMAFTSLGGVEDLIARIVDAIYTAAEYDEFLLFKYLIIKAVSHGKMYPVAFDTSDMKNAAKKFRGMSNQLTFMSNKYNASGVTTTTPKDSQYIFMDAQYNAQYDVDVLASAFNMDKANFMGKLTLIDDFTTFDNERFDVIKANSDMIEDVTGAELALMADVKAILLDDEWFQVYDNANQFTEQYVANGMYWNYFYNVWKTVSSSPFSNAIVFVANTATTTPPETVTLKVVDKSATDDTVILTLDVNSDDASLRESDINFVQTSANTTAGVAVHKYGSVIFTKMSDGKFNPSGSFSDAQTLAFTMGGNSYTSNTTLGTTAAVGDTIVFSNATEIADTLSSLTIAGITTLTPAFDSDVTTYTGSVAAGAHKVTAVATNGNATITIKNGTTSVTNGGNATIASGSNTITVKVAGVHNGTATEKTYTVTVTGT